MRRVRLKALKIVGCRDADCCFCCVNSAVLIQNVCLVIDCDSMKKLGVFCEKFQKGLLFGQQHFKRRPKTKGFIDLKDISFVNKSTHICNLADNIEV